MYNVFFFFAVDTVLDVVAAFFMFIPTAEVDRWTYEAFSLLEFAEDVAVQREVERILDTYASIEWEVLGQERERGDQLMRIVDCLHGVLNARGQARSIGIEPAAAVELFLRLAELWVWVASCEMVE